jgi:hypothetical protein
VFLHWGKFMQTTCPQCARVLEYSGEPPRFCAYCGQALPVSPAASTTDAVTVPPQVSHTDTPSHGPDLDGQAPPEELPEVVGGYRLLRRLGGGGMGSVYEAEDSTTGRRVALKLVLPERACSPEALQRFRQEGQLASAVSHPRSVFVLAANEDAGRPYIVMELMPGQTLDDLVREKGPLPVEQAIAKVLDVIDGLLEAHRLGLVHRDVKPSNCFLEGDGRVKVGDFGLARSLVAPSKLTRTGTFIGTPLFAAPEQIKMETVDAQSDLYSVAATLYFLLSGKAPFQGGDALATLASIVSDDPPPLRSLRPDISKSLDRAVLRGLQRERKRRWKDLEEFRRALVPFLPARPSISSTGLRIVAYLLDTLLLTLVAEAVAFLLVIPAVWAGLLPNLDEVGTLIYGTTESVLLYLAYFAVLEGLWGASLGKRLFRLRVAGMASQGPPGIGRAILRAAVLWALINAGSLATLALARVLDLPGEDPPAKLEQRINAALIGVLNMSALILGVLLTVLPMRVQNGFRALHEFLSGTRTYRLHWPQPRPQRALDSRPFAMRVVQPPGLPEQIGPYRILGALRWLDHDRTVLAEDTQLGRTLWLWLRPHQEPPLAAARRNLSRVTRLRWVNSGILDDWQWDAFLAPNGRPLPDLAVGEKHLSWAELRPILEDLTEELVTSCADGTLPRCLDAAQLWASAGGRAQLLDAPLYGSSCPAAELTAPEVPAIPDQERALAFLRRVAVAGLEGQPCPPAAPPAPVHAPVPVHAADMLDRLLGVSQPYRTLEEWQVDLETTRDRPVEVTRWRRAVHLGLMTGLLNLPFLNLTFLLLLSLIVLMNYWQQPVDRDLLTGTAIVYGTIAGLTASWVVWSFLFRGGYAFWRGGLALRRADGRPPSRLQCGWRALLVWGPVCLLFCLAVGLAQLVPGWPVLYFGVWLLGAALLPLYAVLAILSPNRGPHDRLAGTYLVPD